MLFKIIPIFVVFYCFLVSSAFLFHDINEFTLTHKLIGLILQNIGSILLFVIMNDSK